MKIVFLVLFTFIPFGTFAHQDISSAVNNGNIHFHYKTGWREFELREKISIFVDLSAKLAKTIGYTDDTYIYFDHDYTNQDPSYFALGHGKFSYWDDNKKSTTDITTTGLKLIIRDRDFDIKELLNIINSAFSNANFIKANQKQLIIDLHTTINGVAQFDTLYSIPSTQIKKYLSSSDTIVNRFIAEKTYRNLKNAEESSDIDYYYQNNKFHFYNTIRETEWSKEQNKDVVSKTYKEDILVVDNILEIFGNFIDGYFVFINHNVFYYLPREGKAIGPFKVDGVEAGRPPINKYYHDYFPTKSFTILFYNSPMDTKAIFFPDKNLVISNYDKLENDFINGILNKPNANPIEADTNLKLYLILTILVLSIILNLWLWANKHK